MSVQTHTHDQQEGYECQYCGGPRTESTSWGSYCSRECHAKEKREKRANEVFNVLEQDHRFCATCGRKLKDVTVPPERNAKGKELPSCVIGWQRRTGHASIGERSPRVDVGDEPDIPDQADAPIYAYDKDDEEHNTGTYADYPNTPEPTTSPGDPVYTGTVCNCGNTDHRHEEDTIRERQPFTTAYWVEIASAQLRAEEKHDVRLDRNRLFETVLAQTVPVQTRDGIDIHEAVASAVILD